MKSYIINLSLSKLSISVLSFFLLFTANLFADSKSPNFGKNQTFKSGQVPIGLDATSWQKIQDQIWEPKSVSSNLPLPSARRIQNFPDPLYDSEIILKDALATSTKDFREVARKTALDRAVCIDSVAVNGDVVVVGVYEGQEYSNPDGGVAYIFERNHGGINAWGKVKNLIASDAQVSNRFGYSIALASDVVIVGAPFVDINVSKAGAAYVFERNAGGINAWGEVIKLISSNVRENNQFGYAVAAADDIVIVGAPFQDTGEAYVFERNVGGNNAWGLVKKLTSSDAQQGDMFGLSVNMAQDVVAIGAIFSDGVTNDSGSVYIFERNAGGDNGWGQVKKLIAADGQKSDYFGAAVAIDGDVAIVGAYGSGDGAAYIFERNSAGTNIWEEVKKLTCSDAKYTAFGFSVDIAEDVLVVGAGRTHSWYLYGAVYIFERNAGGANAWGEIKKLTEAFNQYFSGVVATDGKLVVGLGNIFDQSHSTYPTAVYIFSEYGPAPSEIFATANPLPANIGIAAGSNTNATIEPGEPAHADNGGPYHSVWWDWSEPAGALLPEFAAGDSLIVDTHGSDFDTVLAVYTGSTVINLTVIATNDNASAGVETSEVSFQFNSGETYHIAIDGKTASETGNIVLNYAIIPEPSFNLLFIIFNLLFIEWRKLRS